MNYRPQQTFIPGSEAAAGSASTIAHTHLLHGEECHIELLLLRTDDPAGEITYRHQATHMAALDDRQVPEVSIRTKLQCNVGSRREFHAAHGSCHHLGNRRCSGIA